eukprot:CFRG8103T1
MATTSSTVPSELVLVNARDQCIANLITRIGFGMLAGSFLSLAVFKRKLWPVPLGAGVGVGFAYSECQKSFAAR